MFQNKMFRWVLALAPMFVGCGGGSDESRDNKVVMPLDLGIWSPGRNIPPWLIKNGSYESPCLTQLPLTTTDGKPFGSPFYLKTTLIFKSDVLEQDVHFFHDAACTDSWRIKGERSPVSHAYRTDRDAATGATYIAYHAYEGASLIKNMVYLSQSDADFLNQYKICRDSWIPESLNEVVGLNKEECEKDIEKIPEDRRFFARAHLSSLTLHSEAIGFHVVAREVPEGISVKHGSGVWNDKSEHVFRRVN